MTQKYSTLNPNILLQPISINLSQTLDAKIKQKGLVDKSAIAGFITNANFDKEISTISNKSLIKIRTRQSNKITSI